ncbi:hypothetical protein [Metabacillus sp. 22489]|uniref:hypothetical protein n=1 Tax=Metabacillus sp. 22489 TaxID=3453928 RepID=UPI003F82A02F
MMGHYPIEDNEYDQIFQAYVVNDLALSKVLSYFKTEEQQKQLLDYTISSLEEHEPFEIHELIKKNLDRTNAKSKTV